MGPADIDVVAGIGDYLVAGTAALANTTGDTFKNFPEVSFAMGKKKMFSFCSVLYPIIYRWRW